MKPKVSILQQCVLWICSIQWMISSIKVEKIIIFQMVTENYLRHLHEWDFTKHPFSILDVSMMDVYQYAQRHGYDYQVVRVANHDLLAQNRSNPWVKLYMLNEFMQEDSDYDYVVILDVDILFMQFDMSIQHMLDYWRKGRSLEEIDVFLPLDPDLPSNYQTPYMSDELVLNYNTGFQVWKVSEKSRNIISIWYNASIPGCENYYWVWPFEQGVFNHLKTWLTQNHDLQIQTIPCDDANGFPEYISNMLEDGTDLTNHGCQGRVVAHFWEDSKTSAVAHFLPFVTQRLMVKSLNEITATHLWLKLSPEPIQPIVNMPINCETIDGGQFSASYDVTLEQAHDDYAIQLFFLQLGQTYNLSRSATNSLYMNFKQLYGEKLEIMWMDSERTRLVHRINSQNYIKPINKAERILILQIATDNYLRHEWEWFRERFPYSIIDLSKISVFNYAKRHGYSYHFIKVLGEDLKRGDRHPCWSKVYGLLNFLRTFEPGEFYDFIVVIDVDMVFMQPERSIKNKILQWSDDEDLRSIDAFFSDDTECEDCFVKTFISEEITKTVNSGFQIWKNSAKTRKILEEWYNCPVRFPGCDQFRSDWKVEQSALTYMYEYLQDKYSFNMKRIDCSEVNGFPSFFPNKLVNGTELGNHGCHGKFISHFWEETKRQVQPMLVQLIAKQLMELQLSEIRANEIWVNNYNLTISSLIQIKTYLRDKLGKTVVVRLQIPFLPTLSEGQQDIVGYSHLVRKGCVDFTPEVCQNLLQLVLSYAELKARVHSKEKERLELLSNHDNLRVQTLS